MKVSDLQKALEELNWCSNRDIEVIDEDGITHDVIEVGFDSQEDVVFIKVEAN